MFFTSPSICAAPESLGETAPGKSEATEARLTVQASCVVLSACTRVARAGLMEFTPPARSRAAFTEATSPATAMEVPMNATA